MIWRDPAIRVAIQRGAIVASICAILMLTGVLS
jgi:hypothetical protein